MTRRPRAGSLAGPLAGPLAALLAAAFCAAPARAASVDVSVEGIEAVGTVYVALCQGGLSGAACTLGQSAPPAGPARRFLFPDVAPGTWAVAAYQDVNGNGQLDRTPLGLPTEPYAFSGGAGRRARPGFAEARIAVGEPGVALRLRLARALARR